MSTASFTPEGCIEVKGASLPFMPNYTLCYGDVLLTPELAQEGEKFGWRQIEQLTNNMVRVSRTEKDWLRHVTPHV